MPHQPDASRVPSAIDQRRLHDPEAMPEDLRAYLNQLNASITAMQSLDDLGPEGNRQAMETLADLERRFAAAEARLPVPKATAKPASIIDIDRLAGYVLPWYCELQAH
jgi:hypothetical protein